MSIAEKAGFTPGKWYADEFLMETGITSIGVVISPTVGVAYCGNKGDDNEQQTRADARLISAAPDMLEALIEATIELMNIYDTNEVNVARRERGNRVVPTEEYYQDQIKAIEKATGKSWDEIRRLYED
jgi:hypothetical protein